MRRKSRYTGSGLVALRRCVLASAVALMVLSGGSRAHAGVVAYWNFDNDISATAGGSDFDLTAVNGATVSSVQSRFGGSAASFSRASSQYLFTDSGAGNIVAADTDFSYSAWYYLDVANITGSDRYFVMETTAGDTVGTTSRHPISLGLRDDNTLGDVAQTFSSDLEDGGGFSNFKFSTTPNQQWHNVITTYDASTRTFTSYFDGVEAGSMTVTGTDFGNGLVIGGHRAGTGRNFEGYIDDVAVWDEVISASEISRLQSEAVLGVAAVPEPSTLVILGVVGGVYGGRRLLKKRTA